MLVSDRSVATTVRELADGTVTALELAAGCGWPGHGAAREADDRRAAGTHLPLLGLPVVVDVTVRSVSAARAAGAIVLGTVRDAAAALADGAYAVLGRPDGVTPSWRPAGSRVAILTRNVADLPVLGPLLGVTPPLATRIDGHRIGAHGDCPAAAEAAARLSLAGVRVVDVDRHLTGRLARLRGADPLAGADVLITASHWPVPRTHAAVNTATVTLAAPRSAEPLALTLVPRLAG